MYRIELIRHWRLRQTGGTLDEVEVRQHSGELHLHHGPVDEIEAVLIVRAPPSPSRTMKHRLERARAWPAPSLLRVYSPATPLRPIPVADLCFHVKSFGYGSNTILD